MLEALLRKTSFFSENFFPSLSHATLQLMKLKSLGFLTSSEKRGTLGVTVLEREIESAVGSSMFAYVQSVFVSFSFEEIP